MLRIVVEGIEVDYPDGISISMKLQNPLFSSTGWNEAYSYSFSLINSSRNYKIFYGNNNSKKKFNVQIFMHGELFIRGTLSEPKLTDSGISVNVIETSINARQKATIDHFDKLDLPTIQVYEPADSISDKLEKWRAHMYQVTITDPVDQGSHKFPKVATLGYRDPAENDPLNSIHTQNLGMVNAWVLEDYVKNEAVPNSYIPIEDRINQWYTTVSPCIRIDYLIEQVIEYLGVYLAENTLKDIPEYLHATHFSGYVLDGLVTSGLNKYNVHQENFSLSDFLPDNTMISVFDLVRLQFGAYFIQDGTRISIRTIRDLLSTKPIDFSEYVSETYMREKSQQTSFVLSYGLDEDGLRKRRTFLYSELTPLWPYIEPFADLEIKEKNGDEETIPFEHVPLKSNYFAQSGIYRTFADFQSALPEDQYGFTEFSSYLQYFKVLRSDEYPEESIEKPTTFSLGLVRGLYTTRNLLFDPFPTPAIPSEEAVDHLYSYNFKSIQVAPDDTEALFDPYRVTLGSSSIYINEIDNATDNFNSEYIDLLRNTREIDKTVNLPVHKLLEIKKWKHPKHIIQQRNMSFEGLVKEVSFTLTKSDIKAMSIKYVVKNNVLLNDFNNDFNNDYSN